MLTAEAVLSSIPPGGTENNRTNSNKNNDEHVDDDDDDDDDDDYNNNKNNNINNNNNKNKLLDVKCDWLKSTSTPNTWLPSTFSKTRAYFSYNRFSKYKFY